MFWWCVCIFFQLSSNVDSWNKPKAVGWNWWIARQIPSRPLKPPKSPSFYRQCRDFYGAPSCSVALTSSDHWTLSPGAHQSDKSISLPFPAQVSPATASNECSFNLYLIVEWHFPFLLLPSSYPSHLSGNPAGLRLEHSILLHIIM